jgi:hypothetical protein
LIGDAFSFHIRRNKQNVACSEFSSDSREETVQAAFHSDSPSESAGCAPESDPAGCAPESENDDLFELFLQEYPRKVSNNNKCKVHSEARELFRELAATGIDVIAALRNWKKATAKSPSFKKELIPYANRWLREGWWRKYMIEKLENPEDVLKNHVAFLEANYPFPSEAHRRIAEGQRKKYEALIKLSGYQSPSNHIPLIDEMNRIITGETEQESSDDETMEMTKEDIEEIQASITEKQLAVGSVY